MADTIATWGERKERELAFLWSYAGTPAPATTIGSVPDLLAAARDVRRALRIRQATITADLFETGQRGPGTQRFEGAFGRLTYAYQRYDLTPVDNDWLAETHGRTITGRAIGGFFFASAMSAIGALLAALGVRGDARVCLSPMAYFETFLALRTFFPRFPVQTADGPRYPSDVDVLWLDTSSIAWPAMPTEPGHVRLLVVDSSLVEAGSPLVGSWIDAATRLSVPLVLIRSHLKLDTFGVELGRLGSLVVIAPDGDGDAIETLLLDIRHAYAWLGGGFEIPNRYPWLGDPRFVELSRLRAEGIRRTTALLADELDGVRRPGDAWEVVRTPHDLFYTVRTAIPFRDPDAWKDYALARSVVDACERQHLPVFAGSSLAMDRVSFSEFVDIRDDQHHLRVAGADLPPGGVPPLAGIVRDAIAAVTQKA